MTRSTLAHPRSARRGLTLFEVVLAVGVFMMSLAMLSQAITTGGRAAVQARLKTHAVLHCESLMAELVTGARPLQPASAQPLPEAGDGWTWSLELLQGPYPELQEAIVTVDYVVAQGNVTATCNLRRYLRDPAALSSTTASPTGATP